jgi:hypothetical protein
LILLIMNVNEVTDVCCMCHIFACILSVMWSLSIFHTHGAPPSNWLSFCVRRLGTCFFVDVCTAFERAFDVSRFGVGVGVFNFV